MKELKQYLTQSAEAIQHEIVAAFRSLPQPLPLLASEYQLFTQSAKGGKHIRGTLVQVGYSVGHAQENSDIMKVAAAFEILHASLLIHDDVIDRSSLRRGKPTIHKTLGGHYGTSQAICLGDMGLFLATELILQSRFSSKLKSDVLAFFSRMVMDTIAGEMLDIKISLPDYNKNEEDVLLMQRLKTSSYTIVGPLLVGAMLGKASKKQCEAIRQFGEYMGMAFQIQDDILGVFGDEKRIGKSVTSDIEENKSTLLIVEAMKHATPTQRHLLERYYGKGKITAAQHEKIKNVFIETGSLVYSQGQMEEYIRRGKQAIFSLTKDKKIQQMLEQFSEFIFLRKA